VALQTLHADLADWLPAPGSADAVVLVFVHLTPALRRRAHQGPGLVTRWWGRRPA